MEMKGDVRLYSISVIGAYLPEMKGDVRLYSISVIGAYLPFSEELRKQIATYPLPLSI